MKHNNSIVFFRKPFYYEGSNNSSAKKNKDPIYVPMMLGNSEVFYHKNDKLQFKAIGLPYKGDEYTAYFVLPDRNDSLRNLMSTINERTLKQITESTTLVDITYFVPKMTLKSFTNLTPMFKVTVINRILVNGYIVPVHIIVIFSKILFSYIFRR